MQCESRFCHSSNLKIYLGTGLLGQFAKILIQATRVRRIAGIDKLASQNKLLRQVLLLLAVLACGLVTSQAYAGTTSINVPHTDADGTFTVSWVPRSGPGFDCHGMRVSASASEPSYYQSYDIEKPTRSYRFQGLPPNTYRISFDELCYDDEGWDIELFLGSRNISIIPPPTVSVTSPSSGVYEVGATITLAANAAYSGPGGISFVEFYLDDDELLATDSSSPYQGSWTPTTPGSYYIIAYAYGADGSETNSAERSLVINQPPSITLTTPTDGYTTVRGTPITLNANASDSGGSVSRVEFYVNGTFIGNDYTAPYSMTWESPNEVGDHSWYARVYDDYSANRTSPSRSIHLVYDTPSTPSLNPVASVSPDTRSFNVTWSAATGTVHNYYLEERIAGGAWATVPSVVGTSHSFSGKNLATTYEYRVRACNPHYCSAYSTVQSFAFPGTPSDFSVSHISDYGSTLRLNWSAAGQVDNYHVERRIDGGSWTLITVGPQLLDTRSSLTPGSLYEYRARGCNSNTCGQYNNTLAYRAAPTPGAISASNIDPDAASFTVNWGAAAGAQYYQVQQSVRDGSTWEHFTTVHSTSKSAINVQNGGSYIFNVRACNAYDACSPFTSTVTIRLPYTIPILPNLSSSDINRETGSFTMHWTDGGAYGHYYQLHESSDGGNTWPEIYNVNDLSYSLTGRNGGTTYLYKVRSCNVDTCSAYSSNYSLYLPYATPGVPGPTYGSQVSASTRSFIVNWGAASGPVDKYYLEESSNGGASWNAVYAGPGTNYGRSSMTSGVDYLYRVLACNPDGVCSNYNSNTVIRMYYVAPGVPGNMSSSQVNPSTGAYTLEWGTGGAEAHWYKLVESSDGGTTWSLIFSGDSLSFPVSGRTNGHTYQYRVRACNVDNQGDDCSPYTPIYSYYLPYTKPGIPGVISDSNINPDTRRIMVNWGGASGPAHRYELQQSSNGGASWETMYSGSSTGYEVSNLVNGIDYVYRARACNNDDLCSDYTNNSTIRLPFAAPTPPDVPAIGVDAPAGQFNISWNKPSGEVSLYVLQHSNNGGSSWQMSAETTSTSFAPANFSGGITYHFRVQACNVDYCSAFSPVNSAYLPHAQPPLPNLSSTGQQSGDVYGAGWKGEYTVSWSSAGGVVTHFDTEEQQPGQAWVDFAADGGTPNQRFFNKPPNMSGVMQNYRYYAQACNSDHCSAGREITVQVKPYPLPGIPTSLHLLSEATTAGAYTIGWSRPEGTTDLHFYILEETRPDNSVNTVYIDHLCSRDAEGNCLLNPANPDGPFLDEQLNYERSYNGGSSGDVYQYRVRACFGDEHDHTGCDDYSAPLQVAVPHPPPSAVSNFSYTGLDATAGSFTLTWTAATGHVDYHKLEESTDEGTTWAQAISVFGTSHAQTGKTNGTNYRYRIAACNNDCGPTETVDVRMPYLAPSTPGPVNANTIDPDNASFTLSWTAASGELAHYELEESNDGGTTWAAPINRSDTSYAATGKTNGATYHYRVRACNIDACSNYSTTTDIRLPYTAPTAPGVVVVDAIDASNGDIDLSWSAASGQINDYQLEQRSDDTAPWVAVYIGSAPNASLTALINGVDYQYRTRACNSDSCSNYSATQAIRMPYATPFAPGAIVADQIDAVNHSFRLQWAASSGFVAHYELQESTDGGTTWAVPLNPTGTSHTIAGKTNGDTYHYRVRACNVDGCSGYNTTAAVRLPYAAPTTPGIVNASSINASDRSMSLSWTAASGQIEDYRLEQRDNDTAPWVTAYTGTASQTTLSALSNGAQYQYRVKACNSDSCSDYSGIQQIRMPYAAPFTPGVIVADQIDAENQRFRLQWAASAGTVANYELQESADGGTSWASPINSTDPSYIATGKTNGASYRYRVRTCNVDACSAYSDASDVRLPYAKPGIPGGFSVADINSAAASITTQWSTATGYVEHYELQYSHNDGASWQGPVTTGNTTQVLTALTNGTQYVLQLRACNVDVCSDFSPQQQAYLPFVQPIAPDSLSVTQLDTDALSYTLLWTVGNGEVAHYELQEQIDGSIYQTIYAGTDLSFPLTNKFHGVVYNYRVRACNVDACSDYRNAAALRIAFPEVGVPGVIQISDIDGDLQRYRVNWGQASGAVRYYELQRLAGAEWQTISTNGLSLSYLATGLTPGAVDQYRVRACNPDSCSDFTAAASATAPLPKPTAPTLFNVVGDTLACNLDVSLQWTPAGTSNRFEIQQRQLADGLHDWRTIALNISSASFAHTLDPQTSYQYRVRARTFSNDQYSNWSNWTPSTTVATPNCDLAAASASNLGAPLFSTTGEFAVLFGEDPDNLNSASFSERVNGGAWVTAHFFTGSQSGIDGYWLPLGRGIEFKGTKAKPTGVYEYRYETCYAWPQPEDPITCGSSIAKVTVLRDPVHEGELLAKAVNGDSLPIDLGTNLTRLVQKTFQLVWPSASGPASATLHYETQQQVDLSNAWLDLDSNLSSTSKNITQDYGVPHNYRVRACANFNGYSNCGGYLSLRRPVLLKMGTPRYADQTYNVDRELVLYNKTIPIQWLPPVDVLAADIHHYEVWLNDQLFATAVPSGSLPEQAVVDVLNGGQQQFQIRACGNTDQRSCGDALPFDVTVIVPPDAPDIPNMIVGEPHPDGDGTPFNGILSGNFSVTPSGSASYTLPIAVPPGTAGVTPSISLTYSSQSGNGIAGWGWSIAGLSAITRCNKTMAQDGVLRAVDYSDQDAYCLDGQRLLEVDEHGQRATGTGMYRTELNDFRRITRKTGGACGDWFEVRTQANETVQYGNTAQSCVNSAKGIKAWARNRVTDVVGNYIAYDYAQDQDNNQFTVTRIGYTGHEPTGAQPYTWIEFDYELRPDPINGYQGGVKSIQSKRLTEIHTDAGTYSLSYLQNEGHDPTSRIEFIEYCALNPLTAARDQCMAPLRFEWSTVSAGWERLPSRYEPPRPLVIPKPPTGSGFKKFIQEIFQGLDIRDLGTRFLDLDNDGLTDLVYGGDGTIGGVNEAYRNTGDGWVYWAEFTPPHSFIDANYRDKGVRFADINGDGRPDMLTTVKKLNDGSYCDIEHCDLPSYVGYYVYENTENGWVDRTEAWLPPMGFVRRSNENSNVFIDSGLRAVDLNNDGLSDLVISNSVLKTAWRNTGHNNPRFEPWPEYAPDVVFVDHGEFSTGARLMDINGDGAIDIFGPSPAEYPTGVPLLPGSGAYLNDGEGWSWSAEYYSQVSPVVNRWQLNDEGHPEYTEENRYVIDNGVRFADFNGDGLPDLGKSSVIFNTGKGWEDSSDVALLTSQFVDDEGRDTGDRLLDVNADGLSDVVRNNGRVYLSTVDGQIEDNVFALPRPLVKPAIINNTNGGPPVDAGVRLLDLDGDGRSDLMEADAYGSLSAWRNVSDRRRIIAVSDGLGNMTEIKYKVLTDKQLDGRQEPIYTKAQSALAAGHQETPVPLSVVDRVIAPDGIGGSLTTEYAYQGLIVAHGGRGLQSFERITVISPNGQWAMTDYAYAFPYSGIPKQVEVTYGKDGPLLNRTSTDYCYMLDAEDSLAQSPDPASPCPAFNNSENDPIFVYPQKTIVTTRYLTSAMQDTGDQTSVETLNTYGAFGYLKHSLATTTSGDKKYTTETSNNHDPNGDWYWLGRLLNTEVTKIVNDIADDNSTRRSQFEYDPVSGLLTKEMVEPGTGVPAELHNSYAYDQYGNTTITTTCASDFAGCTAGVQNSNSDGEPYRTTQTLYVLDSTDAQHPNGRFPVSSTNSLGHTESSRFDHPLGLQTQLTGPNGITTRWSYDGLGRKLSETLFADTVAEYQNQWRYHQIDTSYLSLAKYFIESQAAGTAPVRVYYDAQGRELQTLTQTLHGQYVASDTRYDHLGRVVQNGAPYFANGSQGNIYWTVNTYDDLGRIKQTEIPLGDIDGYEGDDGTAISTVDYQGFRTITTDTQSRSKQVTLNALGQTEQVIDDLGGLAIPIDYVYDSQGRLTTTTVDNNPLTTVTIHYDARGNKKDMADPDIGYWEYQYNGFGELVWQKDAKGQITEIDYDALGRMTERREYLADSSEAQTSTWIYDTADGAGISKLHQENSSAGSSKTYTYDNSGRLINTDYHVGMSGLMADFQVSQSYDVIGRVETVTYPQVGAKRPTVKNVYSPFGSMWYVLDMGDTPDDQSDDSVYWIAEQVDARGQLEQELLHNRNSINHRYNAATGWQQRVESWDLNRDMIQQTRFAYDPVGNMDYRERFTPYTVQAVSDDGNTTTAVFDQGGETVKESFGYDSLDRITSATITRDGAQISDKVYGYDNLGNIDYKDTLDNTYQYNHNGGSCKAGKGDSPRDAGPHAVCAANGHSDYKYDANGNMTDGAGRKIDYTTFNKPWKIEDSNSGSTVNFYYGADRSRVFKTANPNPNGQKEYTFYVGLGATGGTLYEQNTLVDASGNVTKREHIHFIYAGGHHNGNAFAMKVFEELENNNPQQANTVQYQGTEYYHRDHLGSVIAITDDLGTINDAQGNLRTRLMSFDAFGKQRNPDWSESPSGENSYTDARANLSFTGHESIPEVGLIHMNGRVYNPALGRFLSADPFVQAPYNSQSYNRYSYVINNPIKYNDPSGYVFKRVRALFKKENFGKLLGIGLAIWSGVAAYDAVIASATVKSTAEVSYVVGSVKYATSASTSITVGIASATVVASIASGAAYGGIQAASSTLASGGDLGDILKASLRGAMLGIAKGAVSGMLGVWAQHNPIEKRIKTIEILGDKVHINIDMAPWIAKAGSGAFNAAVDDENVLVGALAAVSLNMIADLAKAQIAYRRIKSAYDDMLDWISHVKDGLLDLAAFGMVSYEIAASMGLVKPSTEPFTVAFADITITPSFRLGDPVTFSTAAATNSKFIKSALLFGAFNFKYTYLYSEVNDKEFIAHMFTD